jgi:CheY-like chemotaxis protein/anti-sigma regulatory factor (Ser/Thr protein kinase)
VLLAEDCQVTRALLRAWMTKAGYQVQDARDGQEAWELFAAARDGAPYDLVITDIVMPRMDGLELAQRLRKAEPDLPIVILTSLEDAETAQQVLHLHINEFLVKPFHSEALLGTLARLAGARLSQVRKEQLEGVAQSVRMAHKVMEAVPEKDLPIFSISEPLTEAGGDVFRTFHAPDGSILFLLADVAGHSVLSSYAVASFLGMLSTCIQENMDVAALFQRLNRTIQEGPFPEVPIATLAARWQPRTGRLHIINAGIPYGLWHRQGLRRTEAIPLDGAPLGLLDQTRASEKVLVLEPGDRLLFATDGLFDVASPAGEPFRERAQAQWQSLAGATVAQALGQVCEAARSHGNGVIGDDLLAIALEQPEWRPGAAELIRVIPSQLDALERVMADFDGFLKQQPATRDLGQARRFEFLLAVREALSNAHRHGNKGAAGERIALHALVDGQAIQVRVVDGGRGFPWQDGPVPRASAEGGRGLHILRASATRVHMRAGELQFRIELKGASHASEN